VRSFEVDTKVALNKQKESIFKSINEINDKASGQISELSSLSNMLVSETKILSEVFKANTNVLEFKLNSLMDSRKEAKEHYGKILVIEEKTEKNAQNINKIAVILKENGLIKGKR